MKKRLVVLLFVSIWVVAVPTRAEERSGEPDAVAVAQEDYEYRVAALREKFREGVEKARAEFVQRLEKIQRDRTRAGNLDGALAARQRIDEVRAQSERDANADASEQSQRRLPPELVAPEPGEVRLVRVLPLDRVNDLLKDSYSPSGVGIDATSHHQGHPPHLAVDGDV